MIPNQGAIEVARMLPEAIQRWLVVDLPVKWFEHVDRLLGLHTWFPPERRISLPASYLNGSFRMSLTTWLFRRSFPCSNAC